MCWFRAKIIVDIGCGSGNVTGLLASTIPHDRLISFDIDPGMVAFASAQNKDTSIEFFIQDFGQPWEKLNPILQSLEGQVDLIWSNRVLHWVRDEDRPNAASTIARLLTPNGRFYANTTLMPDVSEFLDPAVKAENEKIMKIMSRQDQEANWRTMFTDVGLTLESFEVFTKVWTYDDESAQDAERNCFVHLRRWLPDVMSNEEKDALLIKMGYQDLWVRSIYTPVGEPPVESLEGLLNCYYNQFRIVAVKPGN